MRNCGRCGNVCPAPRRGNGQAICTAGMCGLRCTSPQSLCGDGCVDLRTSVTDCGMCSRACTGMCNDGICHGTWDTSLWDTVDWGP